jgi:hypothetical protein
MIGLSMHSSEKGPLTNGQAVRAALDYEQDVPRVIAREGARLWASWLKRFIKNPTPYYWNQIRAMPGGGGWIVTDNNVVYGPWLEGEGSRNRPRPGFPGYGARRKATQQLDGRAGTIAYDLLNRIYIRRMN